MSPETNPLSCLQPIQERLPDIYIYIHYWYQKISSVVVKLPKVFLPMSGSSAEGKVISTILPSCSAEVCWGNFGKFLTWEVTVEMVVPCRTNLPVQTPMTLVSYGVFHWIQKKFSILRRSYEYLRIFFFKRVKFRGETYNESTSWKLKPIKIMFVNEKRQLSFECWLRKFWIWIFEKNVYSNELNCCIFLTWLEPLSNCHLSKYTIMVSRLKVQYVRVFPLS